MTEKIQKLISHDSSSVSTKFKTDYEQFAFWYALPLSERAKTGVRYESEYAEKNGVDRKTLYNWRQLPDFKAKVVRLRQDWGDDMTAAVFDGWKLACMKGNPHAIELWLGYFHGYYKKQVIEQHVFVEVTSNDIRSLVNELPINEQKEFYGILANLADRVRYHRRIGQDRHGIGDGQTSQSIPDNTRALQRQTDYFPQRASDTRAINEMATGNQKLLRTAMARQDNTRNYQSTTRRGEK